MEDPFATPQRDVEAQVLEDYIFLQVLLRKSQNVLQNILGFGYSPRTEKSPLSDPRDGMHQAMGMHHAILVGNCSATHCSVAAPPPGARQGFGGPMRPRHPPRGGRERGATGVFWGGVAATPLLHTQNCGMSRDRGVATPWSATAGGGV